MVLTPDDDHYAVEPQTWFEAFHPEGHRGGLASTVRKSGELMYRFEQSYTSVELERILAEGRAVALSEGMIRQRAPAAAAALVDVPECLRRRLVLGLKLRQWTRTVSCCSG